MKSFISMQTFGKPVRAPDGTRRQTRWLFEKDHITGLSNLMKVLVDTLTFLDRSPEKMFPGWKVATGLKVEIWNRMGKLSLFLNSGLCWESCF